MAIGFAIMVALVGIGLGGVIAASPAVERAMRWAGMLYLLWLAWKIARAGPPEADRAAAGRPLSFVEAALFQWINPKAWVMAVGAVSTYSTIAPFPLNIAVIALVFGLVGLPSSGAWAVFGDALGRLVSSPRAIRAINIGSAVLLVASLLPMLAGMLR